MSANSHSQISDWLTFEAVREDDCYKSTFIDTHIGNPLIRSIHGGVTASIIEMSARASLARKLNIENDKAKLVSSSVDYLRVTKDADLFAQATIVRTSRRLAFVDVWVWQDNRDTPIAKGSCVIKLSSS